MEQSKSMKEFFLRLEKTKLFIMKNTQGILDVGNSKEFINNLMIQILVLWILQERGFFNNDKNYFISKFNLVVGQRNHSKTSSYYSFVISLLEKIINHEKSECLEENDIDRMKFLKNFIIISNLSILRSIQIPNKCFYQTENSFNNNIPILNLFQDTKDFGLKIDGYLLGAICEKLTSQKERKYIGIFYTPKYICEYLSSSVINSYLLDTIRDKNTSKNTSVLDIIAISDYSNLINIIKEIDELRILDPAVGTGHFLESSIEYIMKLYIKIWKKYRNLIIPDGIEKSSIVNLFEISELSLFKSKIIERIVLKNIYGVDINSNVVKIAIIRLFLLFIENNNFSQRILSTESIENLKVGNSLLGYIKFKEVQTYQQSQEESIINNNDKAFQKLYLKYSQIKESIYQIQPNIIEDMNETLNILYKNIINHNNCKRLLKIIKKLNKFTKDYNDGNNQNIKFLEDFTNLIGLILVNRMNQNYSKTYNISYSILKELHVFHWLYEFPEIILKGGFSIILGNPPYIGESGNKKLFRIYRKSLSKYYEGKMDIWYLFLHRSLDLLEAKKGFLAFLTSQYWITASGALKLRKRILNETSITKFINFGDNKLFNAARGVHTNLFILKNVKEFNSMIECFLYEKIYPPESNLILLLKEQISFSLSQNNLMIKNWDTYFHFFPPEIRKIIELIIEDSTSLYEKGFKVKEGIVTGLNRITKRQITKYNLSTNLMGLGVFILDQKNDDDLNFMKSLYKEELTHLKPLYKNSDIKQFYSKLSTSKYIIYLDRNVTNVVELPFIHKHLMRFEKILKESLDNPPYINRPRDSSIFLSHKIITPQRSPRPRFSFNSVAWYALQDVYFIIDEKNDMNKLKSLLLILNSKLGHFWFYWMGKRKGKYLEFFEEPLNNFPVHKNFKLYQSLAKVSNYLLFLHSMDIVNHNIENLKKFFHNKVGDALVFELYFEKLIPVYKEKKRRKSPFGELINEQISDINYEKWEELLSQGKDSKKLSTSDLILKQVLKEQYLKVINEDYIRLKSNFEIQNLLSVIEQHPLFIFIDKLS